MASLLDLFQPWMAFAIAIPVIIAVVAVATRRQLRALAVALDHAGYRLTDGNPERLGFTVQRLHGTKDDRSWSVAFVSQGKNNTATVIGVGAALPAGFELAVSPDHFLGKIVTALGGADVDVGDPDFDRRMRVNTQDADRASFILSDGAREKLAAAKLLKLEIGNGTVAVRVRGRAVQPDRVIALLELVEVVARRTEATA